MAQAKLSRNSQSQVKKIMDTLQSIGDRALAIDAAQIAELVRRDAIPHQPDGYSTDSMPEHTSGGSFSSRTETVAMQNIARQLDARDGQGRNELRRVLKNVKRLAARADVALNDLENVLRYAQDVEDKHRAPHVSDPCSICLVLPAEVSGYCRKDYDMWRDYGQPDRLAWQQYKTKATIKEGGEVIILVPECPPPTATARRGPYSGNQEGYDNPAQLEVASAQLSEAGTNAG